jgi:hypothetical protein
MTTFETDLLAELIRQKLDCLVQLHDVGRRQFELVQADRMTELLDVLAAKQHVLMELQRIESRLDPFRAQDPESRRWRSPDQRQKCARQVAECETLLARIVSQEKQSERELIRRRDDAAVRLQGAHLASQARGAYAEESPCDVSRLDLLSES